MKLENTDKSKKKYFGTDGIRGKANSFPMTPDMVLKVAMATASVLRKERDGKHMDRVVIGKDTRLSGYMLEQAMSSGFVAMGMDVILVGPIPTPGIAKLTRSLRADVGVMISASHNPYQDNGIKLFGPDGHKLPDDVQDKIEEKIDSDLSVELVAPEDLGKASRLDDALGRYIESLKRSIPRRGTLEGLKVVVDCANGAAYKVAPQVLWELEVDVKAIGNTPDGRNINDGYGATATGRLQEAVVDTGADLGIALDGDADRLIMVDERGDKIDGDQLMAALALWMKEQGTLKGGGLVSTVMSNLGLERLMRENGLDLIRTQVGDRYVVEHMRKHGYNLGGEQSGHIVMSDFSQSGDGMLAALQILNIIKEKKKPVSEVLRLFDPLPQILKNVRYSGANPLDTDTVRKEIAGAQEKFNGSGRVLVRESGTEPVIRVMAEGDDSEKVETIVNDLCEVIEKVNRVGQCPHGVTDRRLQTVGLTDKYGMLMSETDESLALLPNGFIDILPPHAEGEARSIDTLMGIFRSNGYLRIKPPLLEFEDSLLAPGPGERLAPETFRLMDPVSHRMLGVRSDITAQVARIVSSRLANEPRPLRLTYANDALRTRGSQMRTVRQFTQVGCELVDNTVDLYPDIEICVLSILGLKSLGLKDLTLDLTIPGFVAGLMDGIDEADRPKAKKAVEQRDSEVLNAMSSKSAKFIAAAMQAAGRADNAFAVLNAQSFDTATQAKLEQLKTLCNGIQEAFDNLGIDDVRITVDLVEQNGFEYHKNYGFTLFAADSRGELGRGGAYDIHFGQKGVSETARGFTLYMDTISRLIKVEPNEKSVFVPVDTPWNILKDLQAQGWVTVRATEGEQSCTACGYVYKNGKVEEQS